MRYMNYDSTTGKILGFFDDGIPEHVKDDITDNSIKIEEDLPNKVNSMGENYIVNLTTISDFDKSLIMGVSDFDKYFEPQLKRGSQEYCDWMHKILKDQCNADIVNLGEQKAHTLAMKQYLGTVLTDAEIQLMKDFLTARDARLAQYEQDKLKYGITSSN